MAGPDITRAIKSSLTLLKENKAIAIPQAISLLTIVILAVAFLYASGAVQPVKDLVRLEEEFKDKKQEYLWDTSNMENESYLPELFKYITRDSEESEYYREFAMYAMEKGYDFGRIERLFSFNNLMLLLVFIFTGTLIGIFFNTMSYAYIVETMKKGYTGVQPLVMKSLHLSFEYIGLKVLETLIVLVPIFLATVVLVLAFALTPLLAALFLIFFILAMIAYVFFISVKLLFTEPKLFLEDKGPLEAIRGSFELTKKSFLYSFIILLIMGVFVMIANSYISNQQYMALDSMVFSISAGHAVSYGLLLLLLVGLNAVVLTLIKAFHMHVFEEYKEMQLPKGVSHKIKKTG